MLSIVVSFGCAQDAQFTENFLKIAPYENWDKRQIEIAQQERVNQATQVNNFIMEEVERFKRGEISTISTAENLATRFSLSHRTAKSNRIPVINDGAFTPTS